MISQVSLAFKSTFSHVPSFLLYKIVACIKKDERCQVNKLKKDQTKPKANRSKEIIKMIRMGINEIEIGEYCKSTKPKIDF